MAGMVIVYKYSEQGKARTGKQKRLTIFTVTKTNLRQIWVNRDADDTTSSRKFQGLNVTSVDKQDTNKGTAQQRAAMSVEQWVNTVPTNVPSRCATSAGGKDISA